MRYLPKSPTDRDAMLKAIGVRSIDDLFAPIPAQYRLNRDLAVPRQMAESEIVDWFKQRAKENGDGYTSFLGAGAYSHYRPVVIDALVQRGEFLTSYTPYQAEFAQGTLQAIFEFQTMVSELTGMDVANASMYDGSTGAAEAVMMAVRITGRHGAVIAVTLHPEYREVIATYATHQGIPLTTVAHTDSGRIDLKALEAAITDQTACVLIQSPNFFGTIEDVEAIAEIAHKRGALLIVSIAEAVSLGIVEPPRTASASEARTAACSPRKTNLSARYRAVWSAKPSTKTASADSCSRSPPASSTSAAKKRLPTSAPIRRSSPSWSTFLWSSTAKSDCANWQNKIWPRPPTPPISLRAMPKSASPARRASTSS